MNRIFTFFLFGCMAAGSKAQPYVPFATDSAQWNVCFFWNGSPNPTMYFTANSIYLMQGDTLIDGKNYARIYESDQVSTPVYMGGLREDSLRQIWYYPGMTSSQYWVPADFPSDTTEYLLYTFDNLQVGDTLPINQPANRLIVMGIDSVLVGSQYRKRYRIDNFNCWAYPGDYWIEGIGSSKGLFSPYSYEFEWDLKTTCYSDSSVNWQNTMMTYVDNYGYVQNCNYYLFTGIAEKERRGSIRLSPNPAGNELRIATTGLQYPVQLEIYSAPGLPAEQVTLNQNNETLDLRSLAAGLYLVRMTDRSGNSSHTSFVKIN